uniref:FLZ-type domain-containing protein n=1 Tax=Pyramimonas orientalis virus TaxID=455367 RepID=A0A7M3UNP3_POV01|nr:hypothetical protein HWQ62_00179 [Pyramimonas orientalis virus]
MSDIIEGTYVFPSKECRYCEKEISSNDTLYMGWSRAFCSWKCRSEYNKRYKNKSILERLNEYINQYCIF